MPVCNKCKEEKIVEAFSIDKKNPHGRKYKCKACYREEYKENREKNLAWQKAIPMETRMKYTREYDARNPGKKKAWSIMRHAIYHGDLVKPKCCDICGEPKPLDGHHEDYNNPLKIDWLCRACHKHRHVMINQEKRGETNA